MAEKEGSGEDGTVAEIEKKIIEAFEVFDHECNKTVDVREIGSIVRSLGCFPTEAELHELLAKALDDNKCGYITKEELVKYLTEEGEPFTQEEMEDMLSSALDPETNTVRYRDYISMMVVDET
ncbi:dynein regulatory complex protein 8 [Grus japonensis]|uniref:Dynein regulatory complex protein 8 n=1 Tax=Grus japonensis TaxID=30415 RepID=A0ABC9WPE0_GRUJA